METNDKNFCTKEISSVSPKVPPPKPAFSTNEVYTVNDRMVSPKKKVEQFRHLYIANNVKTSTFNEQTEKASLDTTKNNLNGSQDCHKFNCSYTSSLNMVPRKESSAKKSNLPVIGAVGNMKIVENSNGLKSDLEYKNNDDNRILNSRQHHHVSVQELKLQVKMLTFLINWRRYRYYSV